MTSLTVEIIDTLVATFAALALVVIAAMVYRFTADERALMRDQALLEADVQAEAAELVGEVEAYLGGRP